MKSADFTANKKLRLIIMRRSHILRGTTQIAVETAAYCMRMIISMQTICTAECNVSAKRNALQNERVRSYFHAFCSGVIRKSRSCFGLAPTDRSLKANCRYCPSPSMHLYCYCIHYIHFFLICQYAF